MFLHQVRLALLSMKRNPILTGIVVAGIALGVAVAMVFVTAQYHFTANPIPDKSDVLFHVQVDAWDPDHPWDDDRPGEPPDQLTWQDAQALLESDVPTHQTAGYQARLSVVTDREGQQPYDTEVRLCRSDFFPMFDVPFQYGSGWDAAADARPEAVVVIDRATNDRLFGGVDSTGETLQLRGRPFRIVGVLDRWRPFPRFYDTHDELEAPEALFIPLAQGPLLRARSDGNVSGWKTAGPTFEDLLQSEHTWLQLWVQLDTPQQVEEYESFLAAHVAEQVRLGRHGHQPNNRLRNVGEWLAHVEVVPEESSILVTVALLFLVVCSINLVGFLLGKFLSRAPEMGVRRALGASRGWVFRQHLIECELVGIAGGLLGVGLGDVAGRLVGRMFEEQFEFRYDPTLLVVALVLALTSAFIAGVYPAWRTCATAPGHHLKTQ